MCSAEDSSYTTEGTLTSFLMKTDGRTLSLFLCISNRIIASFPVDLAKLCLKKRKQEVGGVMEGQVVGRHPEGSGGSPALETLSALMHRRLHDAKMYNWKLHCFGWLDCRAAARYRTLSTSPRLLFFYYVFVLGGERSICTVHKQPYLSSSNSDD